MKRNLALIVILAIVLSLSVVGFAFTASADTDMVSAYAKTRADAAWETAVPAARLWLNGTKVVSDGEDYTVELAEFDSATFAGGTLTFSKGVLTIANIDYVAEDPSTVTFDIHSDGALSVNFTGADLYANILLYHKESDGTYKYVSDDNMPLLLTSDGHVFRNSKTSGRVLSSASGDIIVYGNIGLEINSPNWNSFCTDGGVSADKNYGHDIIIAPSIDSEINTAQKTVIESREGSVIFAGHAKISVASAAKDGTGCSVYLTDKAKDSAGVQFLESVSVELNATTPIKNTKGVKEVINTTGDIVLSGGTEYTVGTAGNYRVEGTDVKVNGNAATADSEVELKVGDKITAESGLKITALAINDPESDIQINKDPNAGSSDGSDDSDTPNTSDAGSSDTNSDTADTDGFDPVVVIIPVAAVICLAVVVVVVLLIKKRKA